MAEEQRCQAPEGHRLCANNCGFFGSSATLNLCSKCYRDFCLKEEQASSAKIAVEKSLAGTPATAASSSSKVVPSSPASFIPVGPTDNLQTHLTLPDSTSPSDLQHPPTSSQPNRCATCRRRVGLTGFRCRCGTTFCSTHRYPEQHGCTFDFKSVGRDAIAKANPVVKAEKLDKI